MHAFMYDFAYTDDRKHAYLVQWHWLVVEAEFANLGNGRKCMLPIHTLPQGHFPCFRLHPQKRDKTAGWIAAHRVNRSSKRLNG